MSHRSHISIVEEYFTVYGRLVAGERKWLELEFMTKTGAERPAEIAEMIAVVKG